MCSLSGDSTLSKKLCKPAILEMIHLGIRDALMYQVLATTLGFCKHSGGAS